MSDTTQEPGQAPATWTFEDLRQEIVTSLAQGGFGDGRIVDGRTVAVKASPARGNSAKIVIGTAALPPGYRTPPHSHDAEEVAVVLSGGGGIDIDGVEHPVEAGSVVLAPANSQHATFAHPDTELVVLWFYAPPGSEARWLRE
jgi:quercetin dioxygenase-like cupin family protein